MKRLFLLSLFVVFNSLIHAQYCIPTTDNGTVNGDFIAAISLETLNNSSGASNAPFYTDYTSLTAPNLAIEGAYSLSITAGSVVNDRYAAWVDWNNDQDFDDDQELLGEMVCLSENQVLTISFQVPLGITTGTKRMRVRCAYQGLNMDPCGNYIWSETEDYSVNIIPEINGFCTPNYAGGSAQGDYIKSVQLLNMTNVSGPSAVPYYDYFTGAEIPELTPEINYVVNIQNGLNDYNRFAVWIDWNNDADFLDANENLGEYGSSNGFEFIQFPFSVPIDASEGIHRMRVRSAFNTIGINPCLAYSFGETEDYDVRVTASLASYCTPTHSASNGHFISDVSMGHMFNPSGELPSPFYLYYSNLLPAILEAGTSNALSITSGYTASSNYSAWIDFNRDGDFNDANEKIGEYVANANEQHSFVFSIPTSATAGATRMRIRCTSSALPLQPCGNYSDGETEDYTVSIVSNSGSTCMPLSTNGNTAGDVITSVISGSLSNVNAGIITADAYHDFPNQVLTTYPNEALDVQVIAGTRLSATQGTLYALWVDWNANNQFELNEKIGEQNANGNTAYQPLHFTFNVPVSQATGSYRMRIRSAFDAALTGSNMSACAQYAYGETQDYRIVVHSNVNYCTSLHSNACMGSVYLDAVRIYQSSLINDHSGCTGLNGNSYSIFPASGNTSTTFIRNNTYSFAAITNASAKIAVWADWNQDGIFSISEYTEITAASIPNQLAVNYITVPANATLGYTRLRVRCVSSATAMTANDACNTFSNGETEEYWIAISSQLGLPPQPNFTFEQTGNSIDFFDFSANIPDFWFWQFQDAFPSVSISQDVQGVSMFSPGCHDVTLTAYNDYGYSTIVKPCAISIPQASGCAELFISEYVDHTLGDAIELFNPSAAAVNLSEYRLALYQNGATTPTFTQALSGSLQSHAVFIISSTLNQLGSITNASDLVSPVVQFDGNDAIALMHNGTIIDVIGQIGAMPTLGWNFGVNYTPNGSTFIRKQTCDRPETNWQLASQQWDSYFNLIEIHQLGQHQSVCGNSVLDAPQAVFTVSTPSICAGGCIQMNNQSTGNPIAWNWSFPGASITSSALQIPPAICYPTPGVYPIQLIVTGPNGSDTLLLTTAVTVHAVPEQPVIVLNGTQLEAQSASSPVYYQWYLNAAPIVENTSIISPSSSGVYSVSITDTNGCQSNSEVFNYTVLGADDFSQLFHVFPNPASDFIQLTSQAGIVSTVEIIDIQGKHFGDFQLMAQKQIPTSTFAPGWYLLRIYSKDKLAHVPFIILPH